MIIQHLTDQTIADLIKQLPHGNPETDEIISQIASCASCSVRATMSLIVCLYDDTYMSESTELNAAQLLDCIDVEVGKLDKTRVEMTKETHGAINKRRSEARF